MINSQSVNYAILAFTSGLGEMSATAILAPLPDLNRSPLHEARSHLERRMCNLRLLSGGVSLSLWALSQYPDAHVLDVSPIF